MFLYTRIAAHAARGKEIRCDSPARRPGLIFPPHPSRTLHGRTRSRRFAHAHDSCRAWSTHPALSCTIKLSIRTSTVGPFLSNPLRHTQTKNHEPRSPSPSRLTPHAPRTPHAPPLHPPQNRPPPLRPLHASPEHLDRSRGPPPRRPSNRLRPRRKIRPHRLAPRRRLQKRPQTPPPPQSRLSLRHPRLPDRPRIHESRLRRRRPLQPHLCHPHPRRGISQSPPPRPPRTLHRFHR